MNIMKKKKIIILYNLTINKDENLRYQHIRNNL